MKQRIWSIKGLKNIKISKLHYLFNDQEDTSRGVPIHRNFNSILRRYDQKNPISVVPISRQTKRAYHRLRPRKTSLTHKGLKNMKIFKLH